MIDEGTAKGKVRVIGILPDGTMVVIRSAGKTGTAQKFVDGAYSHSKFVASFLGYVPEDDPQFVLLVMVDEPKGQNYYGASVAAPAFSEMATQIAEILNVKPKGDPVQVPPVPAVAQPLVQAPSSAQAQEAPL